MSVPRPLIFILPIAVVSLVALMFTPGPRGLLGAASRGLGLGHAPQSPGRPLAGPARLSPNPARPAAAAPSVPAAPPAPVCRNAGLLAGPSSAPAGVVTVPAGDNSSMFGNQLPGNTTYYFAAGTHYLGSGEYSQIQPGRNDTFTGAPGAVISGDNPGSPGYVQNNFAFIGSDTSITGVTIKYLTIEGFDPPGDQGAVNTNSNDQWTIEYDTIKDNVPGAAVMIGSGNTIEYDCLTGNGQYAFNAYQDPGDPQASKVTGGPQDIVLRHNEIAYNDTCNWETSSHFPITPPSGCAGAGQYNGCGCSGGGKFWQSQNVTVEHNYVHDNYSAGIWADTNNDGFEIQGNYFSGNYAEALIYEISYNARISNNAFLHNAWGSGAADSGFPDSAVYISESGGDSRVANGFGYHTLDIVSNTFTDNWGGVILWENADRFCGDGSDDACTLVAPATVRIKTCPHELADSGQDQQAGTRITSVSAGGKPRTLLSLTTCSTSIPRTSARTARPPATAASTACSANTAQPGPTPAGWFRLTSPIIGQRLQGQRLHTGHGISPASRLVIRPAGLGGHRASTMTAARATPSAPKMPAVRTATGTEGDGCGSFEVSWLRCEDEVVAVSGVVDAFVFAAEVEAPVVVEVAVGDEGAEFEDGLGAVQAPSGACDVHSVLDDVPAGAFDDAGGDGPALGQGGGVVQVVLLVVQVAGALVGAVAFGCRSSRRWWRGGGSRPRPGAALPCRILRAWSATQSSASGSPGSKKDQAAFQRYSSTWMKSMTIVTVTPRLAASAVTASIWVLLPSMRTTQVALVLRVAAFGLVEGGGDDGGDVVGDRGGQPLARRLRSGLCLSSASRPALLRPSPRGGLMTSAGVRGTGAAS